MLPKDTILVVDDNPDSLRFLVDTLDAEGMTVLIARSGEATLELLGEVRPDLILMDAVMPGLSGIETTRAIKRAPATAHIPVIFLTGLNDPEHVVAALAPEAAPLAEHMRGCLDSFDLQALAGLAKAVRANAA